MVAMKKIFEGSAAAHSCIYSSHFKVYIYVDFFLKKNVCVAQTRTSTSTTLFELLSKYFHICAARVRAGAGPLRLCVCSGTRSPIVSNLKNLARSSHHHKKNPLPPQRPGPSRTHQCHVKHFRFPQGSCEHPSWSETCRNHANAMVGRRSLSETEELHGDSNRRGTKAPRSTAATFVATKA